MPAIDFLMNSLDMKPTDLDRIVVAQGPGSLHRSENCGGDSQDFGAYPQN